MLPSGNVSAKRKRPTTVVRSQRIVQFENYHVPTFLQIDLDRLRPEGIVMSQINPIVSIHPQDQPVIPRQDEYLPLCRLPPLAHISR